MSEISDEKLAFAARSGDKAAEEQLLQRYKNSVRGAARSYFLEGGETEDLVQEGMRNNSILKLINALKMWLKKN